MKRLILAVIVVSLSGCFSFTTLHTATPIGVGEIEIGVVPQALGIRVSDTDVNDGITLVLPSMEFQLRYGLSEMIDVGFRFYPVGFGADVNIAIINKSNFALSIDPQISGTAFSTGDESIFFGMGFINIIADVVKSEKMILSLALKPGAAFAGGTVTGGGADAAVGGGPIIGGGILAKFQLSDNFAMGPGLDVIVPINTRGGSVVNGFLFNANIGLYF